MFLTIAHRGDPLVLPENTIASVRSAVDKGANTVEFDLRLTKDGVVVLSHDATLGRVFDLPVPVTDLTLAELRARAPQVPTFSELLAEFDAITLLVDLKSDEVIAPAIELLRKHDALDRAILVAARATGGIEALVRLRAAEPDVTIGLDWTAAEPPAQELLDTLRPQYFGPRWTVAEASGVPAMRERGYKVWVGPLVAESDLSAALDYGVDGIVSDDISALLRLRAA